MSMMPVIYGKMMIEKDVRNFILRIGKIEISGISQKFLPYRRNFCHFLSNMFILAHIRLWGQYAQYEKNAEFYSEYSDLEISAIWQKFLRPYFLTIFVNFGFSVHYRGNWRLESMPRILSRIFWSRNFCDMTEISAIWSEILDFKLKLGSYAKMMIMWKKRNSLADMLMQKFLRYGRNFWHFA